MAAQREQIWNARLSNAVSGVANALAGTYDDSQTRDQSQLATHERSLSQSRDRHRHAQAQMGPVPSHQPLRAAPSPRAAATPVSPTEPEPEPEPDLAPMPASAAFLTLAAEAAVAAKEKQEPELRLPQQGAQDLELRVRDAERAVGQELESEREYREGIEAALAAEVAYREKLKLSLTTQLREGVAARERAEGQLEAAQNQVRDERNKRLAVLNPYLSTAFGNIAALSDSHHCLACSQKKNSAGAWRRTIRCASACSSCTRLATVRAQTLQQRSSFTAELWVIWRGQRTTHASSKPWSAPDRSLPLPPCLPWGLTLDTFVMQYRGGIQNSRRSQGLDNAAT